MVPATPLLLAVIAGGYASTYLYDAGAPIRSRLAAGIVTSFAAVSLLGFGLAMVLGLGWTAVVVATTITAAPTLAFGISSVRQDFRTDLSRAIAWLRTSGREPRAVMSLVGALTGLWLVVALMSRAMLVRANGAIHTGDIHNIGDLPFHLTVVSRFVAGNNLPPEHPSFAGAPFTYPFLTDFLSAMLVTTGADLRTALVLPAVLGALALVVLLHQWTLELTSDVLAAWCAPVLLLLGGGVGWWTFAQEVWQSPDRTWAMLANLPHDYTIGTAGLRFGNVVTTLLIPQRGINLGMPLAIVVFRQWWLATREGSTPGSTRRMLAAGLIAGVLPLVHGHTYLVVMGMAGCLALLFPVWRAWISFLVIGGLVGAPQLLWLARGSVVNSASFVGWSFGWDRGEMDAVIFWLTNTGALIPILIWALVARDKQEVVPPGLRRFYLPFLLCFVVPNLVRLAPWVWDNIKILVYWFLASTPVVALVLARWYRAGRWLRTAAVGLALSLVASGALDLWRVWSRATEPEVLSSVAVEFARLTASATESDSTILHAPIHNHAVFLSGRRSFMGYPGHLWSQGLDSGPRERDLRAIYAGEADAANLLARHQIDYVVVGADERTYTKVDTTFLDQYPVVAEGGPYRLYRVTSSRE
jgi:hypothetical protein